MKSPLIITGATGSMGRIVTEQMAKEGFPVIMACYDLENAVPLKAEILKRNPEAELEIEYINLKSIASVKSFVERMKGRTFSGLFNNAGVLPRHFALTEDGFETTMSVNYLCPCLLTRLLAPQMESGARIVSMVSMAAKISSVDLRWAERKEKDFGQVKNYSLSKVSLLYFSIALAERYPDLMVNVSDPGIVDSDLIRMDRWFDPIADVIFRPLINTPLKGAQPAIRALHSDKSKMYFVGKRSSLIGRRHLESPLADQLWDQTGQLLGL